MAKGIYDRFYNTRALLNHHCRCAVVIVFVAVYYLYSYSSWFLKMREFTTGVFKPIVTLSLRYLLTCLTIDYTIQQCKFMLKAQIVYLLGISLQNAEMIRCNMVLDLFVVSNKSRYGSFISFVSIRSLCCMHHSMDHFMIKILIQTLPPHCRFFFYESLLKRLFCCCYLYGR